MNSKTLALLLTIVAVVATLLLVLSTDEGASPEVSSPTEIVRVAEPSSPKAALSEPGDFEPVTAAGSNLAGERTSAPADEVGLDADARWIEGRVIFPPGTPSDESVAVVARGLKFKSRNSRIDRAEVDAEGRFRVAVANRTAIAKLTLESRYLYLEEPVEVELRLLKGDVVLESRLGGMIRVSLESGGAPTPTPDQLERLGFSLNVTAPMLNISADSRVDFENMLIELGGLEPARSCTLSIRTPDYQNQDIRHVEVEAGKITEVTYTLAKGGIVSGRVLDEFGVPIRGASIRVESDGPEQQASVDENGEFAFHGLLGGSTKLIAKAEGFLSHEVLEFDLARGRNYEGVKLVLSRGYALNVLVTMPDGTPVPGAQVICKQAAPRRYRMRTPEQILTQEETDAEGRCAFTGYRDRPCRVLAKAKPALSQLVGESGAAKSRRLQRELYWVGELEKARPGAETHRLVLHESHALRGFIVDDLGSPVTSFQVIATPHSRSYAGPTIESASTLETDSPDGSFVLSGMSAGEYDVKFASHGHARRSLLSFAFPRADEALRIELPRTAKVRGRVLDPDGRAIAGARVEQYLSRSLNELELVFDVPRVSWAECNGDGEFRFAYVTEGPNRFKAHAPGHPPSKSVLMELAPGEDFPDLVLRMPQGATLTGEVHPSVGVFANRTVTLRVSSGEKLSKKSDEAGRFEFGALAAGDCTLTLVADMSDVEEGPGRGMIEAARREQVELTLRAGESKHVVLGAPSADKISVWGRVSSEGISSAGLHVFGLQMDLESDHVMKTERTDATGRYSFEFAKEGQYLISIGTMSTNPLTDPLANRVIELSKDGLEVNFELSRGELTGTVSGLSGNLFGIKVEIELMEHAGVSTGPIQNRNTKTDKNGRYTFEGVPPGTYLLRAGFPGFFVTEPSEVEFGCALIRGVEVATAGKPTRADVELRPSASVSGVVRDLNGQPLAGVVVNAQNLLGAKYRALAGNTTDAQGKFKILGLPGGTVRLYAERQGGSMSRNFRLVEGEAREVELSLP